MSLPFGRSSAEKVEEDAELSTRSTSGSVPPATVTLAPRVPVDIQALLSADALAIGYGTQTVVEDVCFDLSTGDVLAVVGHNGSGKSTLIKTLLGTLPPIAGTLAWPAERRPSIGYLGQRTEFDTRFPIRVRDLAAMGAWPNLGPLERIDRARRDRVKSALERTDTAAIADLPLHKLSAGQLQRALFARTIVQDAQLILLDEPFVAVDQATEAALLTLIDDWAVEGRTLVLVLHDLSAVLKHCTSALLLGDGHAVFGSPKKVLTPDNLVAHRYLSQSQADWIADMYSQPEWDDD